MSNSAEESKREQNPVETKNPKSCPKCGAETTVKSEIIRSMSTVRRLSATAKPRFPHIGKHELPLKLTTRVCGGCGHADLLPPEVRVDA